MSDVETVYSRRLWGRGRLLQLATRAYCRVMGHVWREWNFDWPYDVPEYWEEMGTGVEDPGPEEELLWYRGCGRDCGSIQQAWASLLQRASLPGPSRGLAENPIRSNYGGEMS